MKFATMPELPRHLRSFREKIEQVVNQEPAVRGYVMIAVTADGDAFLVHGGKDDVQAQGAREIALAIFEATRDAEP